ncbi:hypothetical protein [Niabella hibiscisoli]|uniref:hypothetical protein n=1 Tax=Niabella hibiscisoli TaxID=1825928 RepID=UPI001F0FAE8B|nr:hypothetical protein [Niabella hibiscisoli]MCH5717372.1 hypothetical protein [Niabella hibiscisoli]
MKFYLFATILLVTVTSCSNKTTPVSHNKGKMKARFEVSGICSNYTFSLIEGDKDTSLVQASWTNPQTDSTYTNAFGVKNPCDLPEGLKVGDEFYFELDNDRPNRCMVCMAYYPTPAKKLNIKVLEVVKK